MATRACFNMDDQYEEGPFAKSFLQTDLIHVSLAGSSRGHGFPFLAARGPEGADSLMPEDKKRECFRLAGGISFTRSSRSHRSIVALQPRNSISCCDLSFAPSGFSEARSHPVLTDTHQTGVTRKRRLCASVKLISAGDQRPCELPIGNQGLGARVLQAGVQLRMGNLAGAPSTSKFVSLPFVMRIDCSLSSRL
ncbi:hypothetical protein PGT21_009938 [Puccinia graminis f. sp. tritici]|uniref:Uncharacterized protein n=1 Tax=Puccinia graminis f. sp. tritici TaxID=56615 RepID=A0A5B0Q2G1_PUCGR|nr:hypothetical protein PGT21_009938 [Puccinia graminis f. sp. tritici]KAA1124896.1 hypothetical protein PGTUg99_036493 [Puccinia graminis f. sp. tritici]